MADEDEEVVGIFLTFPVFILIRILNLLLITLKNLIIIIKFTNRNDNNNNIK